MSKLIKKYKEMPAQLKAAFWFLICSFLQKGISVITTPIFTRLLTTTEYGQYNVFNSWLDVVTILVTMNLYSGVYTQGLIKYDKERNVYSSSLQGLTTVLVVVWTILYTVFQSFWNSVLSLTTIQMYSMLIMIWMSAIFNFWAAEQRVYYRYKVLVLISVLVALAKPIIGIVFVTHAEDKVTARILGIVLVDVFAYTFLYIVQMKKGKVFFSKKFWTHALAFNIPLIPHYLSQIVLNSSDRIMISNIIGNDAAGIYSLAYSIALLMTLFTTTLTQTISPWMYQKIKEERIQEIAPIAYITLIVVGTVNVVLIAFAPEMVAIFAPTTYKDAIWVIPPVAMSVVFLYCYDLFAKFEFYYEKTKYIMIVSVLGAILNICLNFIFIQWFGYIAAGYTTLFCFVVYSVGHYIIMTKVCKIYANNEQPYSLKKLIIMISIFLGCSFVFLATYKIPLIRYSLILVMGIIGIIKRKVILLTINSIISIKKKS